MVAAKARDGACEAGPAELNGFGPEPGARLVACDALVRAEGRAVLHRAELGTDLEWFHFFKFFDGSMMSVIETSSPIGGPPEDSAEDTLAMSELASSRRITKPDKTF